MFEINKDILDKPMIFAGKRLNFIINLNPTAHGTAITPFISVLEHFKNLMERGEVKGISQIHLYFGIRNKSHDYLFEEKLNELFKFFKDNNPGTHIELQDFNNYHFYIDEMEYEIHVCESRPDSGGKLYVQHQIKEHMGMVENMMGKQEGTLFVCGDGGTSLEKASE